MKLKINTQERNPLSFVATYEYPIIELKEFTRNCLMKVGVSKEDAESVSEVLAAADLRGKDSHGIARLRRYVEGLANGKITHSKPEIIKESVASALLDGHNGLGQSTGILATKLAIQKANITGVGIAAVRNTNHFGIAGYYANLACQHSMIGIVITNASPQVAPTFGGEPMYGTNPIAIGIPIGGDFPFLLDMATSIVSRGRLERLLWYNKKMPDGWVLDHTGEGCESLSQVIEGLKKKLGYSLLPLGGESEVTGGHKGYGLGIFIDLLCGPVIGSAWGQHVNSPHKAGLGQWFIVINPAFFGDLFNLQTDAQKMVKELHNSKKVETGQKIYIPGEKSSIIAKQRADTGIPLASMVVKDLQELSKEYNVPLTLSF